MPSILVIDDERTIRLPTVDALKEKGYEVDEASNGDEGLKRTESIIYDLVITDLKMPGRDGLQVVKECKLRAPSTEVIVMTAHGSVETAVKAMKLGAYDYLQKPFGMEELLLTVERATKVQALQRDNTALRMELDGQFSFDGIIGKNARMRQIIEYVKLVALRDTTVLVLGESGTGKEIVANAIHRNSPRNGQRPSLVHRYVHELPRIQMPWHSAAFPTHLRPS